MSARPALDRAAFLRRGASALHVDARPRDRVALVGFLAQVARPLGDVGLDAQPDRRDAAIRITSSVHSSIRSSACATAVARTDEVVPAPAQLAEQRPEGADPLRLDGADTCCSSASRHRAAASRSPSPSASSALRSWRNISAVPDECADTAVELCSRAARQSPALELDVRERQAIQSRLRVARRGMAARPS